MVFVGGMTFASAKAMAHSEEPTLLARYRSSLAHIDAPLGQEEEWRLAEAWRSGDEKAGRLLVESSLPFVIKVAREYLRWGVPLEDLIQQGNIGLLKAASKYEPERQCRLITYAVYWIRAEIRDYVVRSYRIVRLGTTRTERHAMRIFRRQGVADAAELASESGMPLQRAEQLWPLLCQSDLSLDAPVDERASFGDRFESEMVDPEARVAEVREAERRREALKSALADLSEREQLIVESRLLAEEPKTLEHLGKEMGVSKERVRQIESRLRGKLKDRLTASLGASA